jgi:hypothetical protein
MKLDKDPFLANMNMVELDGGEGLGSAILGRQPRVKKSS